MSGNSRSECNRFQLSETDWNLFDELPTAILLVSAAGVIVRANARAERILGPIVMQSIGDVIASPDPIFYNGNTGDQVSSVQAQLCAHPATTIGYTVSVITPSENASSANTQSANTDIRFAVVFQDLSPLQRLKEERDRLLQLAAVGETLPAVLHEVKNPLAGITTAVEVLLEEVREGHVKRELSAILTEVRRIKLALEGIGLFNGELHTTATHAIDKALGEVLLVLEPVVRMQNLRIVSRVAPMPPLALDVGSIRAFVFNLVTNAMHATPPGGQIEVSTALKSDSSLLELRVSDTGRGMTPEVLAKCRDLFFTTKSNGSGVGLALCSQTVARAGGTMTIETEQGRGTSVTLLIPTKPPKTGEGHVTSRRIE